LRGFDLTTPAVENSQMQIDCKTDCHHHQHRDQEREQDFEQREAGNTMAMSSESFRQSAK
jgi:hypothetical protein